MRHGDHVTAVEGNRTTTRMIRVGVQLLVAGATASVLGGCGAADQGDVQEAARSFYEAVGSGNGATACGLLVPPTRAALEQSAGQPCGQAVVGDDLPPGDHLESVEVHGQMAMVRWWGDHVPQPVRRRLARLCRGLHPAGVLVLQSLAGWRSFDAQQAADGLQRIG